MLISDFEYDRLLAIEIAYEAMKVELEALRKYHHDKIGDKSEMGN